MKTGMFYLIFLSLTPLVAYSQLSPAEIGVMQPIHKLFEGMQKGDSAMLHSAFTKQVTLASIGTDKEGKTFIRYESSLNDFLKAIGTPHPEAYNEMIWGEKILIDHNFAQVWTDYAFYKGKKFSHCGVDAFHLVKEEDGTWKIFHLADTRQKDGCNVPPAIQKKVEQL